MKYDLSEITAVIKDRRTIYPEDYTPRKVHRELLENILNNAIWAPTHGKTQPWRFKVYTDKGLEYLSETLVQLYTQLTPAEDFIEAKTKKIAERPLMASAVVVICMKRTDNPNIPEIEEVEAVACAVQNMALTCTAYGLGSFWASPKFLYHKESNKTFGLAEEDKILGLFYIGYTDKPWPKSHRKPLEYVVEWIDEQNGNL